MDGLRHRPALKQELLAGLDPASMTLRELCGRCVTVLPSSGIALQLASDGQTAVSESSDGPAARAADLQTTLGEGPTVDALRTGGPVFTSDLTADERWPQLAAVTDTVGYRAAIAVPLLVDSTELGALTAYYDQPRAVDAEMITRVTRVARVLIGVLLTLPVAAANGLANAISVAAAHQGRIHQAAGMVAVDEGCSVEEALVRLRAYAYAHEQQLAEVAESVVDRGLRLT